MAIHDLQQADEVDTDEEGQLVIEEEPKKPEELKSATSKSKLESLLGKG